MSFLTSIKNYFYQSSINEAAKLLQKVPREMININDAKDIGILFNATQANDIIVISQFADQLKALNKNVSLLAFINNNEK